MPEKTKQNSRYWFIFLIIVVISSGLLFYYFPAKSPEKTYSQKERPTPEINKEPESPTAYAQVDSLNTLNSSDETWAIEADLESTDLSSLLLEIPAIETELEFQEQ